MKTKYVVRRFLIDRSEYGRDIPTIFVEDCLQWLTDRNITTTIESYYDAATMCYRVHIVAEFDRETYVEYKMVWE